MYRATRPHGSDVVGDEVHDRGHQQPGRLAGSISARSSRWPSTAVGVAQVGGDAPWWSRRRPAARPSARHHRVVVHVDHPRVGGHLLHDLVGVVLRGQPRADVDELPDPLLRHPGGRPLVETPVGPAASAISGTAVRIRSRRRPVDREVVPAAAGSSRTAGPGSASWSTPSGTTSASDNFGSFSRGGRGRRPGRLRRSGVRVSSRPGRRRIDLGAAEAEPQVERRGTPALGLERGAALDRPFSGGHMVALPAGPPCLAHT